MNKKIYYLLFIFLIVLVTYFFILNFLISKLELKTIPYREGVPNKELYYSNFKDSFESINLSGKYLAIDYSGNINMFDNNFKNLKRFNFYYENYSLNFWKSKITNKKEIWFNFDKIKYDSKYITPSREIIILNVSNNDIKQIRFKILKNIYSYCFDEKYAYVTSFQNGLSFGFAKIDLIDYSIINENIIENGGGYPELVCFNDNKLILTTKNIFEFKEDSINNLYNGENKSFFTDPVLDNKNNLYFLNSLEKQQILKYDFKTNKVSIFFEKENFFTSSIIFDNLSKSFYLNSYRDNKLISLNINSKRIIEIGNFKFGKLVQKNNFILGTSNIYNIENNKIFNLSLDFQPSWQSLIYIGNFSE